MGKSKKKKKTTEEEGVSPGLQVGTWRNMPPWMGGSCPDVMWGPGGNIPPWMGGRCPDDMWGPVGDMSPWTRDPCPDDTWQPRKRKRRKYTQPNITDPCPIMGDPSETMSSGPNAPDQRQCRTFGGPRKSSSGKKQPMDQYGTNSWENGPLPPGNCSSDQTASGNATGNASDIQRYYTEEGAARILSNFGLSTKDLEEFGHYSDEQLKPENMAMILRDIVERKKARQLPTSSQGKEEETSGGHGGSDSLMKRPLVPSAAQPATTPAASVLPQSSVSPSLSMMNDYHAVSPTVLPHLCTLCQIECANMTEWNLHVGTTAHSEKCDQLRQQHEGDKKEKHIPMPCSTTSNPNASQHSVPGHALSQTRSRSKKRKRKSRASKRPCSPSLSSEMSSSQKGKLGTSTTSPASSAEPPNKSDAQKLKGLPTLSMMRDYYAASPRIFPHVCSLCNIKCRHLKEWKLHVGTTAHSEKCDQLRQQYPDWNAEDCSLLQRHEGDKKEKHIQLPCSTNSKPNGAQPPNILEHPLQTNPGHQELAKKEAATQEEGDWQSPAKSDVAEQPPNKSEHPLQTNPGHQELPKKEAATQEQGDWQPPAKSDVAEQPPNTSENPLQTNPGHQELDTMEAATQEQGDWQPPAKSDVAEQPPNTSENPLQTNPGHQELDTMEAATQEQGDWQPPAKSDVAEQPPNTSENPLQTNPGHQELDTMEAATQEQGDRQLPAKSDVAEQPPNTSKNPLQTNPGHQELATMEAATQEQGDRELPAKSDVAEQPPNTSENSLQTNPGHQELATMEAATQEQGAQQLPAKSDVAEQPPNTSENSLQTNPGHQELATMEAATQEQGAQQLPAKSDVAEQPPNMSELPLQTNPGHQVLPKKEAATQEQGDWPPPAKSDVAEQPPKKSEHPLQTNPGHQELPKEEAATQEQSDRQREDLLRLALRPLAEQSVTQVLSLLQSGGAVGAGLAQGTSLSPLPPVQIDPTSLSIVSLMQLVATQVVQAALASQEVSCVQGSPGVAGPSPRLCIPAGSEEKKQESSQRVVPGVTPSCSACMERREASGSKGDLTPSTLSTVPWLQKKDARPPKQNLPAEIPAGGWDADKRVQVLIAGHRVVFRARRRALQSILGSHLGLSHMAFIQWFYRKKLPCGQVLPTFFHKAVRHKPDIVILQAEDNEIGVMKTEDIVCQVVADLEAIRLRWPGAHILWSNILPRRDWSDIPNIKVLSQMRRDVNRQVEMALFATGDGVISHPQINPSRWELYENDGISLSAAGNDIFLSNLRTEIEAHILRRLGEERLSRGFILL
ncbi:uncharacterized protein LOC117053409 isoform X2 [Lacerta agilis]|uniref:uncharacterized protein LOC117053409 isoform X2 n=1 Tax=Lacerta agilis TaxID=80427 RepID=UPI001419AAE4|nr:uncharacterized protein LOC117053409 isoform X2 [Lacerta agilis]